MLRMNELLSKFPKQTSLALACRTQSTSRKEKEEREIHESICDIKNANLVMRRVKNGTEKIYTSEQVRKNLSL
jgi:predicted DNA-binding protein